MATLMFNASRVKRLINHAIMAPDWSRQFGETRNPKPQLVLVKDEGIYVMSNGIPALERFVTGDDWNNVVYADTFNPALDRDVWDRSYDAVGGDDFAEYLDILPLLPIPDDAEHLVIDVNDEWINVGWR